MIGKKNKTKDITSSSQGGNADVPVFSDVLLFSSQASLMNDIMAGVGTSSQQRRPQNGPKPFLCPVLGCTRTFYHKRDLNRHTRQKHSAE